MDQNAIFFPMIALVALTFIVLLQVPIRRFKAAFARKVTVKDFRHGESANVPGDVSIPNRNLINLLETPVLFYVACLAFHVAHAVDQITLTLAWVYVGMRVLHSIVHLTYNNVIHRLVVFAASAIVLMAMWVRFCLAIWS